MVMVLSWLIYLKFSILKIILFNKDIGVKLGIKERKGDVVI